MRILIVEDDAVLGMVCALALQEAGYEVLGPVHDMASFDRLAGLDGIELALVDINLAGGNEGLEVARRLRERHRIPSLFVSGQLGAARDNAHLAVGLLRKPYDVDDLLGSVAWVRAAVLRKPDGPAPAPVALERFQPA